MKTKKILFLPKYTRMGASSRLRTYQYLPLWEVAGYQVSISPFFNDGYLNALYAQKGIGKWNVLGCYCRRFFLLFTIWKYDLVWIEKELFPFMPPYAEWLLSRWGKGYVVDYDDAVFHRYDRSENFLVRKWMGSKIDLVMQYAHTVFAGSPYIAERAALAGADAVHALPTVIDPSRYYPKKHQDNNPVTIGWIGSPTTQKFLDRLLPVFRQLRQQYAIRILLVNGHKGIEYDGEQLLIPWTEETEVASIHRMDIGIMPLPDSPWERGKCAYKLIQYMACALPVVASPVGVNKEVVRHGTNGYLATTDEEWIHYLGELIRDAAKRKEMGKQGHSKVQREYTIEKNFARMVEVVGRSF